MWGGASALCIMSGAQNEDDTYKKSIALQLHLMAWELPDTVMVRERTAGPAPSPLLDALEFSLLLPYLAVSCKQRWMLNLST